MAEFKLGRLKFVWKGVWSASTVYVKDDVVRYGGKSYVALLGHTSQSDFYSDLNAGSPKWSLMTDGIVWKNTWTTTTYYKIGDIVKYGGRIYACNLGHTSQSSLEADQSKWDIVLDGITPTGNWNSSTVYKVNDLVKFGADQYICTTAHTSTSTFDTAKFTVFVNGLQFQNSYASGTTYSLGDVVTYGGYVYSSLQSNNVAHTPSTSSSWWSVVTTGFEMMGTWSSATSYKIGDVVSYGAYVYVAVTDNTNFTPSSNPAKWSLLTTGISWKGTWTSSTVYKPGDAVLYNSNSYISTVDHTAAAGNRPDVDLVTWNTIALGAATNVMTTQGDTIYYNSGSVARLPIGSDGKVLRSTSGSPTWSFYGLLNDTYFVAPTGTDAVGYGFTIDAPWKTIAYACQQIAAGPANPYAQALINNNSSFMQAEIDNYMLYTYRSGVTGTSSNNFLSSATSGLNVGMPVRFANITKSATQTYASQTLTLSSSTGTVITVNATMSNVTVNQPLVFSNTFGNIVAGTKYYVQSASGTSLSISSTPGGSAITVGTGGTGTVAVHGTIVLNSTADLTLNSSFTFSGTAFGGLSLATTYYVSNIINSTLITISTSSGGAVLTGITASTGTMTATFISNLTLGGSAVSTSTTYYIQNITTNTNFSVASSNGGSALVAAGTGLLMCTYYYDSTKAKRDTDDILDSVAYDLGRGGNSQTVATANKYFSNRTTYTTTNFSYMVTQVVGSLTYLSTLIANVLAKTAPSSNYQNLMFVASPVTQVTSGTAAESGTTATAQSLISVVSNAINEGVTTAIPLSTKPNITLDIKTGTYFETLPIVVPAFTSLIGEELKSVTVQPAFVTLTASSSSSTTINVSSTAGVVANMAVWGDKAISDGTYVVSFVANTSITVNTAPSSSVVGTIYVGYAMADMFRMRDGTGVRNMTVKGLLGGLTTANANGTKRPTGGSYFSLDPGAGTTDETVWISTRSPYIQNVTSFGSGCTGLKVDGALHGGGNKSMVANDFTNILSDGMAIWCTNNGLVEAVSVFSYYGYAGYLSELGGAIRATNGNSSYGTYGVIAEGTSATETAITGKVTTQSQHAIIANVLTGSGQILWVEYANAGQSYSSATFSITSGSGTGASISSYNYYTNGINEVRLSTGGAGYVNATGVGQSGNTSSITISAADTAATGAYNGMRIIITAGTGAGQYGYISAYNASTKVATILKDSDGTSGWDTASGAAVVSALDASTRYSIEPRVTFTGVGSGALARAVVTAGQISAIRIVKCGSGYTSTPTMAITDPNLTTAATWTVMTAATGVLGQPTWTSRGTNYSDASITVTGNGFADYKPTGFYVYLQNLTSVPLAGSNIVFTGNSTYYIIVQVLSSSGSSGNYSAYVQINPGFTTSNAPAHNTNVTITINYSQARLTGHDFLYVGSGNYYATGFPNSFSVANHIKANETQNVIGGRVFFTSTDQDGNFNVGNLFVVQQSTGVATLSANLFNLSGLNQLQFASGGASITQFSTDGNMTSNSDSLVPTQRAIRAYISSQLGAGGSNITANSVTAGSVNLSGTTITTTNSNNLTISTTGTSITLGSATTQITTLARGQTSFAPSTGADLTNKTYVDAQIIKAAPFAYFMGK